MNSAYQYQRESDDEALFVRMGSNYINKDGVLTTIKKSKCHPKFNMDTYDYDICLLELKEPIKFNKNIQPIKIAEEEPKGGEIGRLAGWGTLWVRIDCSLKYL